MKKVMAAAALTLLAGCAAQHPHTSGSTRYSLLTEPAIFASQATSDRAAEEAMAQLALQRSKSDDVKAFSRQVLADDTADDPALQALDQHYGVAYPGTLTETDQFKVGALQKVAHGEFDRIYMDTMVDSLRDGQRLYAAGTGASSPEVAAYAKQYLPAITGHVEQSQRVDVLVGGGLGPVSGYTSD